MDSTTSLKDFPDYIREGLAYHEAFRRLGFPSDKIFLAHTDGRGPVWLAVVLRAQDKEFICVIHPGLAEPLEQIQERWAAATMAWNSGTDSELDDIWVRSEVFSKKTEFLFKMLAKGFQLPADSETRLALRPDSFTH